MEKLIRMLIDRLAHRGMELASIPAFIRNLANTIAVNPDMSLPEINRRLQLLGWDDFELDYYSLQLLIATFEWNSSHDHVHRSSPTANLPREGHTPANQDEEMTVFRSYKIGQSD